MTALAALSNVWWKLPGMITEIGLHWATADLANYGRLLLECFDTARLIRGGDWPVVNLSGNFPGSLASAQALSAGRSDTDLDQLLDGTVKAVYGIGQP